MMLMMMAMVRMMTQSGMCTQNRPIRVIKIRGQIYFQCNDTDSSVISRRMVIKHSFFSAKLYRFENFIIICFGFFENVQYDITYNLGKIQYTFFNEDSSCTMSYYIKFSSYAHTKISRIHTERYFSIFTL